MSRPSRHILPVLAFSLLGFLYLLYAVQFPIFEGPDEQQHYNYIRFLAVERRLPNQTNTPPDVAGEGYQPPFAYSLAAVIARVASFSLPEYQLVNRHDPSSYEFLHAKDEFLLEYDYFRSVFFLRVLGVIEGILMVFIAYKTFGLLFSGARHWQLLATGFVGLLPQFAAQNSYISNDPLSFLLAAALIYFLVVSFVRGISMKRIFFASMFVGLGLVTKSSLFLFFPVLIVATIWLSRGIRTRIRFILIAMAVIIPVLISGWWYLRNISVYGDLFASSAQIEFELKRPITDVYFAHEFFLLLKNSFFGYFGKLRFVQHEIIQIPLQILYGAGFALLGIAALNRTTAREQKESFSSPRSRVTVLFGICIILQFLLVVLFNLQYPQPHGRFLFPTLVPIAFLVTLGYERILTLSRKNERKFVGALFFILLLANVYTLFIRFSS